MHYILSEKERKKLIPRDSINEPIQRFIKELERVSRDMGGLQDYMGRTPFWVGDIQNAMARLNQDLDKLCPTSH